MFKLQKNKIIVFIIIILIIVGYLLYNKFNKDKFEVYTADRDFILYGTNTVQNQTIQNDDKSIKNKIVIHIEGEVNNKGIVKIEEGGRIIDAVNEAGGFTEYADTSKINLAYLLKDGQKVVIPSINDIDFENEFVSDNSGDEVIQDDKSIHDNSGVINLNTATIGDLQTLPGIGESTAKKIIDYREENGNFKSVDDIKNVSGIGESKFNAIKDMIEI